MKEKFNQSNKYLTELFVYLISQVKFQYDDIKKGAYKLYDKAADGVKIVETKE